MLAVFSCASSAALTDRVCDNREQMCTHSEWVPQSTALGGGWAEGALIRYQVDSSWGRRGESETGKLGLGTLRISHSALQPGPVDHSLVLKDLKSVT